MPETMPKSVNHIAFPIASTAAAHEFYTKILGCKLIGAVREDRIPSTGGAPELVVEGGYAARFSPDGKTLVIGSAGKLVAQQLRVGLRKLMARDAVGEAFDPFLPAAAFKAREPPG